MNLVFDIGANIGNFTQECLNKYNDCKVILVEPNDDLVVKLKNRFSNNNVVIINKVISSKSGEYLDFFISDANTISTASKDWVDNSRFSNNYKWEEVVKKETITIDDLINKYGNPDLIKVDVEGYEFEAIKGLSKKQGYLCFEWAEEQFINVNKTCEYLESIGYKEFGFIYEDEYLKYPEKFTSWGGCGIHKDINIERKEKWGMIWVR